MRYNPLRQFSGTLVSVRLAVSAASDYQVRAEARRRKQKQRTR